MARLDWVYECLAALNYAAGGTFTEVQIVPHEVDPIRAVVRFRLGQRLPKGSYHPLKSIISRFAAENECAMKALKLRTGYIEMTIYLIRRTKVVRPRPRATASAERAQLSPGVPARDPSRGDAP